MAHKTITAEHRLLDQPQLDQRNIRHEMYCRHTPQFVTKERHPKYINALRPEPWGVYRVCKHGLAMRWRGTKEACEKMREQYELNAALHAMTQGTPAEGEKLCPDP